MPPFRCLNGSVGVAPGSYTLQLGAPMPCVDDVNGPVSYGVPMHGWYDTPAATYTSYFVPPSTSQPLDPYGTDSQLKAPTIAGVRLDVLGIVAGVALGIGLAIHRFAKR